MHKDVPMESQHARSGEADDDAMNSVASTLEAELLAEDTRAVPVSMDAFLAQVERRAFRMAEINCAIGKTRWMRYRTPCCGWSSITATSLRRNGPRCSGASCADASSICSAAARCARSWSAGWAEQDDDGDELPLWEPADTGPGPLERLHDAQSYADMAAAVKLLPQRQREAFMLRMLEGLDVAETAQAMGCSEGSVKTHLSRALQRLRDLLEDWR